ncbi:MAG: ADP-ribosylglycohydrolase family protein [Armatimonadota bacterium]
MNTSICKPGKKLELPYDIYFDKVLGGWIGKSLGGIVGAPFEAHKILGDMKAENSWPKEIAPNDDLDIQVVWLEMLEECGPIFTSKDLVDFWQDRCWYNFAEYGYFLYNAQRGINPPLSGGFNNRFFSESMGCPIRAEIWGLATPGNPGLAAEYARMDGELDHIDNSVWSEQFWAAAVSAAFFVETLEDALDAGRSAIPQDSEIYRISILMPQLYERIGDWRRVWKELIRRYGSRDCSKGLINFAFTMLSLYEGKGDMKRTIVTAVNCGWDTDCTAATAAALIGTLYGTSIMPEDWTRYMGDHLTCDVNVRHKTSLLTDFAKDTCIVGIETAMSRNSMVEITDIPTEILAVAESRARSRPAVNPVTIDSFYPDEPVLYSGKPTQVLLRLENKGLACSGELSICAPEGIFVSPFKTSMTLSAGGAQEIIIEVRRSTDDPLIKDKNLFEAQWKSADGCTTSHTFGLVGCRQWAVYGPYWDAYDTTKFDVNPYRNDEKICHPIYVEGCQDMLVHQHVRLDRAYLDEAALLTGAISSEEPFIIERGEDHLVGADLGSNIGESCYYLVRDFVSEMPIDCSVAIGCTGPVTVWLDGVEMVSSDKASTWYMWNVGFGAHFNSTPKRMVIKSIKPADEWKFSISFYKIDVPGDKTIGHSMNIDCIGNQIIEG